MKISIATVKSLINFELPPVDELVKRINAQLGGVEDVIDLGAKYKDAVIVKIVNCEKHPSADRLSVCEIDIGEKQLVQVVCGAPNVKKDMLAVWLPPESIVPSTFDDKEPFKLGTRELRGVMSSGMLAAGDELAINSDHDGIIEITDADVPKGKTVEAGTKFAEVFDLNDTIIDIENKMFTHRPDCFGQIGVAREIAGIFEQKFVSPGWYLDGSSFEEAQDLELNVFNDAAGKVPRFMAVALKDVEVRPSPLWLQCKLVRIGGKPINNIVDATNYIMLMTGQPTHAYDYDKLHEHTLGARMAKKGESVTLLNGKTYELDEDDIVIADGEGPVGLGGVMGGGESEVSNETKNIVLECANFDMYTIRKMSMKYGLFTDAVTRFNKGQSPLQNSNVLLRLVNIINILTHGKSQQGSSVFDIKAFNDQYDERVLGSRWLPQTISVDFINDRLGLKTAVKKICRLLDNVEMNTRDMGGTQEVCVTPPFWRTDLELPEDIVEEVGRLHGFDKLPRELPKRSMRPTPKNLSREVKQKIRESLSRAGANEVLTYSFVNENILRKAGQDIDQAFCLSNALSPDLQYYRLSVLPSLLDKVHMNIKTGYDEFVLFEIGKGHNKKYHLDDDNGLPKELEFIDAVYASKKRKEGAAYYRLQRMLVQLCRDVGFELCFMPIKEKLDYPVTAPFDQSRSALVETRDGIFIGMIGELKSTVVTNFKLPHYTAGMTLDIKGLKKASEERTETYTSLSRFPSISHDISIKVSSDETYENVFATTYSALDKTLHPQLDLLSIYQSKKESRYKTITFRVTLTSYEKTLINKEAKIEIAKIETAVRDSLRAEIV
jgi:phenylalanyl-tRNA synthetase beta chain